MASDPLTDFVTGNYSRKPSPGNLFFTKLVLKFGLFIFPLVFLWVFSEFVNEFRPAWKLETAEAVVVSKTEIRHRRIGHRSKVSWTFADNYSSDKKSFSGYDRVSLAYLSKIEVGDRIQVQYNPSKRNTPDNVRIKGSTSVSFILSRTLFLILLLSVSRMIFMKLKLAKQNPQAFEDMIAENMGLKQI